MSKVIVEKASRVSTNEKSASLKTMLFDIDKDQLKDNAIGFIETDLSQDFTWRLFVRFI
jgi:hypothetical protein